MMANRERKEEAAWNTAALIRYLDRVRLQHGKDQRTFLTDADIAGSWLSNFKSNSNREPALRALAKLRAAYNVDVGLMLDILEDKVTIDDHGQMRRR